MLIFSIFHLDLTLVGKIKQTNQKKKKEKKKP